MLPGLGCAILGLLAGQAVSALQVSSGPSLTLNNGVKMPLLAFAANIYSPDVCRRATADALTAGFRNIWSSELIGEACQRAQREAIDASGLARSELFVAGTVNNADCNGASDCYHTTTSQARKQLEMLSNNKTLDMLMLDYPSRNGCDGVEGQWKAFEELYRAGNARVIAVSNFGEEQLACLARNKSATLPAVNQMSYSAENADRSMLQNNQKFGIAVQAYSPLGSGGVLQNAKLHSIAKKHGKTPAQVALRWLTQQGVAVALASTSLEHLKQDVDVFGFTLSKDEMSEFDLVR
jgi:diketogulonate reductase-like aldo/keto reductase